MLIRFYDSCEKAAPKFSVMIAVSGEKLVFCKHRQRETLEFPGGHIELGETPEQAARRELYEETGATEFSLKPVCIYSVTAPDNFNGEETFGMLYFADIKAFESELHSEIEEIVLLDELPEKSQWTYPLIQYELYNETKRRGFIL